MSKHTRDDRPTEVEAMLATVIKNPNLYIEVATYSKRKFRWTREQMAYADVDWIIEDARYSDDPTVILVGGRITYTNAAVDDLYDDFGTAILAGVGYVEDGPIMQTRKKNAAKIAEQEREEKHQKSLEKQIKKN